MKLQALSLLSALAATLPSFEARTLPSAGPPAIKPRPMVIWHGLGDTYDAPGLLDVAKRAEEVHPGIHVHRVYLNEDAGEDRKATFFGDVNEQVEFVCSQLAAVPELVGGFDALGFSQGGEFLRAYVERCNNPPVFNLVTFGSPHNGVASFDVCRGFDFLCRSAMALLAKNAWTDYVQTHVVPAQYYRDPEDIENYRNHSRFLADLNGESTIGKHSNETYKQNIASLEMFVMYKFLQDTTLIPKETSWFAEYNMTTNTTIPLAKRKLYTEDWIGLKSLGESDRLKFIEIDGKHMQISDKVLDNSLKEYFGKPILPRGPQNDGDTRLVHQGQADGSIILS